MVEQRDAGADDSGARDDHGAPERDEREEQRSRKGRGVRSVRPSAFGPPPSTRPAPPAEPSEAVGQTERDLNEALDGMEAEALGHDPFRGPDSQPPFGAADSQPEGATTSDAPPEPEPLRRDPVARYQPAPLDFEESEVTSPSLVAARSGLLPIPEDDDPKTSSEPPADAGTGPIALALFAFMLLAAVAVTIHQWSQSTPTTDEETVQRLPPGAMGGVPAAAPDLDVPSPPTTSAGQETALAPESVEVVLERVSRNLPGDRESASSRLVAYARTYLEENRPEVADALLRRALQLHAHNAEAAAQIGQLRLEAGELNAAEEWASRAVELAPDEAYFRLLYGDVLERRGRPRGARQQWRKARTLDPDLREAEERLSQSD